MLKAKTRAALAMGLLGVIAALSAGGDPSPPPGPVGSTMVTLDAIEPRNILKDYFGDSTSVVRLTQPGQYVATENIVVPAGKSGIVVDLPPGVTGTVSIDLNGFEIQGQPGSLDGVRRSGETSLGDFVITKGLIRDMGGDGVHVEDLQERRVAVSVRDCNGDGLEAVRCPLVTCGVAINQKGTGAEKNRIAGCGGNGVVTTDCDDVDVSFMSVSQCGLDGVHIERSSRVSLTNTRVSDCGDEGIDIRGGTTVARTLIELVVVIAVLDILATIHDGLHIEDAAHVSMKGVHVRQCGGDGVELRQNDLAGRTLIELVVVIAFMDVYEVGGDGLRMEDAAHVSMNNVQVRQCGGDGVELHQNELAERTLIELVVVIAVLAIHDTGFDGLHIDGGARVTVQGARVARCIGDGIDMAGVDMEISDSSSDDNGQCGIATSNFIRLRKRAVSASNNGAEGMRASGGGVGKVSMQDFQVMRNGFGGPVAGDGVSLDGCESVNVSHGECSSNAGNGLRLADLNRDGMLDLVTCSSNGGHGVVADTNIGLAGGRIRARDGLCDGNGGDGIFLSSTMGGEISDYTVSNNGGAGMSVLATGHVVHRNTCISNTGGPLVVVFPGNSVGPLVDEGTISTNCNPSANQVR